jgi:CRP/FNR family transcriptional regulator, cyclic AMP receptor protein
VKTAKRERGFLSLLSADVIDSVEAWALRQSFSDGQMIHERGDDKPGFSIVKKGGVRLGTIGQSGNFMEFAILRAGDVFGEMTVLTGIKRVHDAYAMGTTEIAAIPAEGFRKLMEEHRDFQSAVLKLMARRLQIAYERIEDVLRLPLTERIAQYLIETLRRSRDGDAVMMRQSDVAEAMAASRVSVSKSLGRLSELGFLRTGYGRIDIINLAGLTAWLAARADVARDG